VQTSLKSWAPQGHHTPAVDPAQLPLVPGIRLQRHANRWQIWFPGAKRLVGTSSHSRTWGDQPDTVALGECIEWACEVHRKAQALEGLLSEDTQLAWALSESVRPDPARAAQDAALASRLNALGLQRRRVPGNGDCQFLAALTMRGLPCDDTIVHNLRVSVSQFLLEHINVFIESIPPQVQDYVSSVSKMGVWGDGLTLSAIALMWNCKFLVVEPFMDPIAVGPDTVPEGQEYVIAYIPELHYDATEPLQACGSCLQ